MDKRSLEKRARRRLRRDRAVIDHLIDHGIDGKSPRGRVHSPTTAGGQPVEDQIVDPGVLDLHAVEPRHQVQPCRVGDLVRGDDPRPKTAPRVEILAGGDRVLELNVADRAVIEAGIAEDVAQCLRLGDMTAGLADDERQLALVIEIAGDLGAHHRLVVSNQGVDEAQKDRRIFRRCAAASAA